MLIAYAFDYKISRTLTQHTIAQGLTPVFLCSERKHFEVEYALRGINKPVGVSEFRLSKTLPTELANKLPNPAELEKEILRELGNENTEEIPVENAS